MLLGLGIILFHLIADVLSVSVSLHVQAGKKASLKVNEQEVHHYDVSAPISRGILHSQSSQSDSRPYNPDLPGEQHGHAFQPQRTLYQAPAPNMVMHLSSPPQRVPADQPTRSIRDWPMANGLESPLFLDHVAHYAQKDRSEIPPHLSQHIEDSSDEDTASPENGGIETGGGAAGNSWRLFNRDADSLGVGLRWAPSRDVANQYYVSSDRHPDVRSGPALTHHLERKKASKDTRNSDRLNFLRKDYVDEKFQDAISPGWADRFIDSVWGRERDELSSPLANSLNLAEEVREEMKSNDRRKREVVSPNIAAEEVESRSDDASTALGTKDGEELAFTIDSKQLIQEGESFHIADMGKANELLWRYDLPSDLFRSGGEFDLTESDIPYSEDTRTRLAAVDGLQSNASVASEVGSHPAEELDISQMDLYYAEIVSSDSDVSGFDVLPPSVSGVPSNQDSSRFNSYWSNGAHITDKSTSYRPSFHKNIPYAELDIPTKQVKQIWSQAQVGTNVLTDPWGNGAILRPQGKRPIESEPNIGGRVPPKMRMNYDETSFNIKLNQENWLRSQDPQAFADPHKVVYMESSPSALHFSSQSEPRDVPNHFDVWNGLNRKDGFSSVDWLHSDLPLIRNDVNLRNNYEYETPAMRSPERFHAIPDDAYYGGMPFGRDGIVEFENPTEAGRGNTIGDYPVTQAIKR